MTHQELLAKLDKENQYLIDYSLNALPTSRFVVITALRAVVELHKPLERLGNQVCKECTDNASDGYSVYPCNTIYAIEKELKG